jgi:hypothetical protein
MSSPKTASQTVRPIDGSSIQEQTSTQLSNSDPSPSTSKPSHTPVIITLLTSPRILTDLYGAFISIFVLVSFDAAIPLFTEDQFGWTSTKSGLIFLFISLPVHVSPLAGQIHDKHPFPWITASFFLSSFVVNMGWLTATIAVPVVSTVVLERYIG